MQITGLPRGRWRGARCFRHNGPEVSGRDGPLDLDDEPVLRAHAAPSQAPVECWQVCEVDGAERALGLVQRAEPADLAEDVGILLDWPWLSGVCDECGTHGGRQPPPRGSGGPT